MADALRQLLWCACYYLLLISFLVGIYCVNIFCWAITFLINPEKTRRVLHKVVQTLLSIYFGFMIKSGILHSNYGVLKRLQPGSGGRLIIANHPSIVDALFFLSRIPGLVCVYKSSLKQSFAMGRTAKALGYLSNDKGIDLLKEMAARLEAGEQILLFPEGTRTSGNSLKKMNPGYALAALRAKVPVQLIRIRINTPILGKGRPFFKAARFPVTIQFDFGPCIEPDSFTTIKGFNNSVQNWFCENLDQAEPTKRHYLPFQHRITKMDDGSLEITFRVPDDPFYCQGHMPSNPLVPAYAQMAWVHEILRKYDTVPEKYFRWKFLQPILPGHTVDLTITPPSQSLKRNVFIIRDSQRVTQGKLLYPTSG